MTIQSNLHCRLFVVVALSLAGTAVAAETTCFGSSGLLRSDALGAASHEDATVAASLTDAYLRALRSDSPNDALVIARRGTSGDDPTAHNHLNGLAAPDARLYFRRAYSTDTIRNETGAFVVAEFGLLSAAFHALHFVVWRIEDDDWSAAHYFWVRRCAPGSRPVRLNPDRPLLQTTHPVTSTGEDNLASAVAGRRR